jgi:hypothetical protein
VQDPFQESPWRPDFTIVMQEVGAWGTREGAGNILAMTYDGAAWSQPINLTPDDRVHQRFAAVMTAQGELVVAHHSPAVASARLRSLGLPGRSAGAVDALTGIMTQNVPAVADPAISYCRVSDAFAGPGAKITAKVGVENRGLSHTPTSGAVSSLGVKAVYVSPDGTRKEVGRQRCPILTPGEETVLSFNLTVPRAPVKISFEVDPVAGELNSGDNVRVRSLGAQPPLAPTASYLKSDRRGEAALLQWKNNGLYDGILLYRDGKMVTELPGTATSHVDRGAGLLNQPGLLERHEYALRGVRGQSRSIPATCLFTKAPPGGRFKRGDTNGDGILNITDGVYVLNFLFLGGKAPPCRKAADTDDSGILNITDGVYVLNFLFLGGKAPPAPYPFCGLDPTEDLLDCATTPSCLLGG